MKYVVVQLAEADGEQYGLEGTFTDVSGLVLCETMDEVRSAVSAKGLADWAVFEVVGGKAVRTAVTGPLAEPGRATA